MAATDTHPRSFSPSPSPIPNLAQAQTPITRLLRGKRKKKREINPGKQAENSRKQVATTSSGPASRQIGKCASIQYCRLQSLQFPARNSFRSSSPSPPSARPIRTRPPRSASSRRCSGARGASSGIMVLLLKQVHLQNEVGAAEGVSAGVFEGR